MDAESQAEGPEGVVPVRRLRRRWRVLGGVVLLPLLAALVLPLLLIGQEIAAPSWLARRIEAEAGRALGGGTLHVGRIDLTLGRDLHPRVRLSDVRLDDAKGAAVLEVPRAVLGLSPRGLVLDRRVLVQRVEIADAQVRLDRAEDGSFAWAFGGGAAPGVDLTPAALSSLFDRPGLAAVERLAAEGLVVTYADGRSGRSWTLDGGRLVLDRQGPLTVTATAAVLSGRSYPTTLSLEARAEGDGMDLGLSVVDAPAPDLADQVPALGWLAALDAPLSLDLATRIGPDGRPGEVAARLSLSDGRLALGGVPLALAAVEAEFALDPATGLVRFDRLSAETDRGRFGGSGQSFLDDAGRLVAQLALTDVVLPDRNPTDGALRLPEAWVDLRLGLSPFRLDLGQVVVTDETGARLQGDGRVFLSDHGWEVAADLRLPAMDVERLAALWPADLVPGARVWVVGNLPAARFTRGALALRLASDTPPRVSWSQSFEVATIRTWGGLPPITAASGRLTIADRRLVVALEEGEVTPPEGGTVDASGSTVILSRLGTAGAPVRLSLHTEGPIPAALSLLDQRPLGLLTGAGLPVDLAEGRAEVDLVLGWPLLDRLPEGALTWQATGRMTGVTSDALVPGRTLEAAALDLSASPAGLEIAGALTLSGVPMTARWRRPLGPEAGAMTVDGTARLSQGDLAALGIALPAGLLSGRGEAEVAVTLPRSGPPELTLTTDLAGLALALPQLGWTLPAGATGRLELDARLGSDPQVTRLDLEAPGLSASGAVELRNGTFSALRLGRLETGGWLDVAGRLERRAPGLAVVVTGGSLDLRRSRLGAGEGGAGGDAGLALELALDRVQVTEAIALTGFRGTMTADAELSGRFEAAMNGGAALAGTVTPGPDGPVVRVRAGDAGALLRAAGLFPGATGGALDLVLTSLPGVGRFEGELSMGPLRVRDVPALAALLDAVSIVGLLQQLDGQGLAFETVEADFALAPDLVTLRHAAAMGPGLGLSLDGYVATGSGALDLQGVVSPFYFLNQVGSILTRPGEGLVGIAFTLGGTLGAPEVSVNPFSLLTPGMFREIFRRPPPGEAR